METKLKLVCLEGSIFLRKNQKIEGINLGKASQRRNPYPDDDRSAIPTNTPDNLTYVTATVQQVMYCSKRELWPIIDNGSQYTAKVKIVWVTRPALAERFQH